MKERSGKTAIAIRHVHFEDLGSFEPLLQAAGYEVAYVEAGSDQIERIDPAEPDILVVLGGPIGAYDERLYPFVLDELLLVERRLLLGLPVLGICLGAQIMARALGARVYAGAQKEIGWSALTLSEAGRYSCIRHLEDARVLHWHGDTFDLPEGAMHLASTPMCRNQAFSWGASALALQFHVEVQPWRIERWLIGHACEIAQTVGLTALHLRTETRMHGPALGSAAEKVFNDWLFNVNA
jgi:GMP synthase (glutamine-hydrolysing)